MVHPSHLTPMQRLLLAISLPITLVFLYFLFRKNDDEDDEEADAQVVTSRQTTIEVEVPHDAVGAVIGVQGAQIKMIKNVTKARLNFKEKDVTGQNHRTLIIQGTREGTQKAELLVRQIIADQPQIVTEVVRVPSSAVSHIIGRNGETIRSISHLSKAKLTVEQSTRINSCGSVAVNLKGTPIAVDMAKTMILEKVRDQQTFPERRLVERSKQKNASVNSSTGSAQVDSSFVEVNVSAVEHPGHFWVVELGTDTGKLHKLIEEMTKFYGESDSSCCEISEPVVGDLVAAYFPEDKSWYRARVADVMYDEVDLYFVDFGDSLTVSKDKIRRLRDDFKDLPFQAKECSLAYVKPSNGVEDAWSEEAITAFEDLVHVAKWKALMSRVIADESATSSTPQIQLIDTNGKKKKVPTATLR